MPAPIVLIPTISFADVATEEGKQRIASELRSAAKTTGFFLLHDHGIEMDLLERTMLLAEQFFALPKAEKVALSRNKWTQRGYDELANQTFGADKTQVDCKEGLQVGLDGFYDPPESNPYHGRYGHGPNLLPSEERLPGMRETMKEYTSKVHAVGTTVMQMFALSLGLDEHYFDPACKDPMAAGRMLHYPSQPPESVQIGTGAHADFGFLTLLLTSGPGLEVLVTPESSLEEGSAVKPIWYPVDPPKGHYIVNIGDLGHLATNGEYKSSIHRVYNTSGRSRYSLPFFLDGNSDVKVEPFTLESLQGDGAFKIKWDERFAGSAGKAKDRVLTVEQHMRDRFDDSYSV